MENRRFCSLKCKTGLTKQRKKHFITGFITIKGKRR